MKFVKSRKKDSRNQAIIMLDVKCKNEKKLMKEIKQAIRKWNCLLDEKLSFQIAIINSDNNHLEE